MGYQTQREKIRDYFLNKVYPTMDDFDLDYAKTISQVASDIGCSETMAEDVIQSIVKSGKIKEYRAFILPEEEIIRRRRAKVEQFNKDLKEAGINGK